VQDVQQEPEELQRIARRLPEISERDIGEIIRLAWPTVSAMLLRRFRWINRGDLEDVLLESFEKFWRYRRGFNPSQGSITAYLYAIARNVAFTYFRKSDNEARFLSEYASQANEGNESCAPVDKPNSHELRDIENAVRALPQLDQELIVAWVENQGANWASEFAQRHNLTANSVRVRRIRLLEKLRSEMKKLGHNLGSHV